MEPLLALFLVISAAYVASEICKHLGIPRVVGEISAGIVIGASFLRPEIFSPELSPVFAFLSDMGLVLLFFFVGLGISLRDLRRNARESTFIAIANTTLPFVLGIAASLALCLGWVPAIVVGICLSVSSQAVALDFLEEYRVLRTRIGELIVAAGAVDDIFELLLISAVLAMINVSGTGVTPAGLVANLLAFLVILAVFRQLLVPYLIRIFERGGSKASLFMGAILIMLLMAALANIFGIGSVIGALIAGILVRNALLTGRERKPWKEHYLAETVHTVSFGLFIPIFFVVVGLNTSVGDIVSNLPFGLLITCIAIAGTLVGTMAGVLAAGGTMREGVMAGWGLNAKGDTEIVIATLALQGGIIGTALFSSIIFMALLTTLIPPIMFRQMVRSYAPESAKA